MSLSAESYNKTIIIEGVTDEGQTFRPSDWAERLCGDLSTFHKHRIIYSRLLYPTMKNGRKCVAIDPDLKKTNTKLYESILDFAKVNHLKICEEG